MATTTTTTTNQEQDADNNTKISSAMMITSDKIKVLLLSHQQQQDDDAAYVAERHLVAWVLLTRMEENELKSTWNEYGSRLEAFAIQILLQEQACKRQQQQQRDLYLRIFCQAMARVLTAFKNSSSTSSHQHQHQLQHDDASTVTSNTTNSTTTSTAPIIDIASKLRKTILSTWKDMNIMNTTTTTDQKLILELHMDVTNVLERWMNADPTTAKNNNNNNDQLWETIWRHYVVYVRDVGTNNGAAAAKPLVDSTSTSTTTTTTYTTATENNDDDSEKEEEKDWSIMGQTLEQLLEQSHLLDYNANAYDEMIFSIFQTHGLDHMPDNLLPSILQYIMTASPPPPPLSPSLQMAWHEWVLTVVQTRLVHAPFRLVLTKDAKALSCLHRLIMIHIVSPQEQNNNNNNNNNNGLMRAMAWQTLVRLVDTTAGWNCMYQVRLQNNQEQSTTPLGDCTALCTWVRLASGEWRIQLQSSLSSATSSNTTTSPTTTTTKNNNNNNNNGTKNSWSQVTGLPIGHACAQILTSVVQYCIELSEAPHRIPFSQDGLLHLRQSLEQALWTTVEYLLEEDDDEENAFDYEPPPPSSSSSSSSPSSKAFATTATQLLGNILMEIDIWNLLQQQSNLMSPDPILRCLQQILPHLEEPIFLPALVNIFGQAENDDDKLLKLQNTIWDPAVGDYLVHYWHRLSADGNVVWACSCTEYWSSQASPSRRRSLTLAVLDWIQAFLRIKSTRHIPLLSLVVGCYMTLCQDRTDPPKEHEARLIAGAIQLCNKHTETTTTITTSG